MYELLLNTLLLLPAIHEKDKQDLVSSGILNIITNELEFYEYLNKHGLFSTFVGEKHTQFIYSYQKAKKMHDYLAKMGYQIISKESEQCPRRLKSIISPTVLLYYKGNLDCINGSRMSLFGTELTSDYALASAEIMGHRIAEYGHSMVANLGATCDSSGLRGCLNSKGRVIGLLNGNGVLSVGDLERIIKFDGCFVGRLPTSQDSSNEAYIDINHLKIGLSDAIIIVSMSEDVPIEAIKSKDKELYCLIYPLKHRDTGNEALVLRHEALPIRNKADFGELSRMLIANIPHHVDSFLPQYPKVVNLLWKMINYKAQTLDYRSILAEYWGQYREPELKQALNWVCSNKDIALIESIFDLIVEEELLSAKVLLYVIARNELYFDSNIDGWHKIQDKILTYLVSKKVDLDMPVDEGDNALRIAFMRRNDRTAKMLIKYGAQLNSSIAKKYNGNDIELLTLLRPYRKDRTAELRLKNLQSKGNGVNLES